MSINFPHFYDENLPLRIFFTKNLIGINVDKTVQEAAQMMTEFNITSLVVLENENVVGFFTESDIRKKLVAKGKSPNIAVKEIMTSELITIDITSHVKDAMRLMVDNDIKHLLVEEKNEIVGIITYTDFLTIEREKLETFIAKE